ncbi:hypothetical protein QUF70_00275 [Desulfobacterales bacterium HSG17]|nr:hypothetical protein [Desulfobacterales bacterium HSG17]
METEKKATFDNLVEQYLGMSLPQHLAGAISWPSLPDDAQNYILRLLVLMKRSKYSAAQFNPILLQWLSFRIPNMLPRAWGGHIPPITFPLRHKKLDDYVEQLNWTTGEEQFVFVDIGCGFPPVTTAETAQRFPDWQIIGVDQSFADYVLYNKDGHYACFDQKGEFQYFQMLPGATGSAALPDPVKIRNLFEQLFSDLFPLLKDSNSQNRMSESGTVEKHGNRLIHNHICNFETGNLRFFKSETLNLKIPPAKVCRIMNMLMYFKPEIRKNILYQARKLLCDDGIIITGTNGFTTQSRHVFYQKKSDGLFPTQFAFSLDNLGHLAIMPWFTIQKNDPEAMLLAKCSGIIRSNRSFWTTFSKRLDSLLMDHDICWREKDGYLHFPQDMMPINKYISTVAIIWQKMQEEGFTDSAVNILVQNGFDAWKNSVGDIAVKPPADSLL